MYTTALVLHSWIRWIALVAVIGTVFAAIRRQDATAERWSLIGMMLLDIQMLIGLALYFALSPNMREILARFGDAMKDPVARFWAVEHITTMFAAIIAAHIGRALARKAPVGDLKRRRLLVWYSVVTVFLMIGMPWPGRPAGRPFFRV